MLFVTGCFIGFLAGVILFGISVELFRRMPIKFFFWLPLAPEVRSEVLCFKRGKSRELAKTVWKEFVPGTIVAYLGYVLLFLVLCLRG